MADWSDLQSDLIGEIAKTICNVEDFVVFSSVCSSWKLAAVRENWVSDHRQLPWLVLAEAALEIDEDSDSELGFDPFAESDEESQLEFNHSAEADIDQNESELKEFDNLLAVAETEINHEFDHPWRRGFFNFDNNKRYDLDVPNLQGCKVFGGDHGFIFTFNIHLEMHLINPLSGLKLSLPHYTTLKHLPRAEPCKYLPKGIPPKWYRHNLIYKALLFKRNKNHQLLVAVIYREFNFLAIAQPGDHSWTHVDFESLGRKAPFIDDLVFSNGQLFALCSHGSLLSCQLLDTPNYIPKLITVATPPPIDNIRNLKIYLVESIDSLLLVARQIDCIVLKTLRFDVYRIDFEKNMWMKVETLGDRALFVGDSNSMSLSSAEIPALQRNSIYFTDDNVEAWKLDEADAGHDMGVYNLDEDNIHPLPYNFDSEDLGSSFSCPVWMVPTLF